MTIEMFDLKIVTRKKNDFIDLTDEVDRLVRRSHVTHGIATAYTTHVTTGLLVQEYESNLLHDMAEWLKDSVSEKENYNHHRWFDERVGVLAVDAWAHIRASFFSSNSVTVPVRNGTLFLGPNQRILLVEFNEPRERHVAVQVLGE